jgi:hypothetical protein
MNGSDSMNQSFLKENRVNSSRGVIVKEFDLEKEDWIWKNSMQSSTAAVLK